MRRFPLYHPKHWAGAIITTIEGKRTPPTVTVADHEHVWGSEEGSAGVEYEYCTACGAMRDDIKTPERISDVQRPGWDEYFLDIASAVSARADCRRRKVGFVLVDEDHRILATGYNGSYPGGPSCLAGECPRGLKTYKEQAGLVGGYDDCISCHAEANGLLFARTSCKGSTGYVTDPPCPGCMKLLASAGVKRVVWSADGGMIVQDIPG